MGTNIHELERFVGTWDILTLWHGQSLHGAWASVEWIEDGAFLRMRSDAEPDSELAQAWGENAPFPITVIIGADDPSGTYGYQYADGRPVHRVYGMSVEGREWRTWGVAGPEFHQRSIGVFSEDGNRIDVRIEQSPDGENWELDFESTYVRR
jgi:hypothetical protein